MNYEYERDTVTYELAPLPTRFLALVIDTMISSAIGGALGANGSWFLAGLVGLVVGIGYQWGFLVYNNGQTPGKMLLGLRVIKVDGSPIEHIDAVMRYIGYTINTWILMLGWLWAVVDDNRQGFHDKLARTYVIKVPEHEKQKNKSVTV